MSTITSTTSPIEQAYIARTPQSAAMGPRAQKVMPAGETRAAGYHLPYPLTLSHGKGSVLTDIDGNDYIDLSNNFTSLLHGHAYPPIVEAVSRVIGAGTAWPARNNTQIELAELIAGRVPSIDLVRFCNSGSEANMLALHVARVHTGRLKVLTATYGYHGSHEAFEAGFFGNQGSHSWPHTITAPWGDAAAFEQVLAEHGHEIAAVFLEGFMGSSASSTPPPSSSSGSSTPPTAPARCSCSTRSSASARAWAATSRCWASRPISPRWARSSAVATRWVQWAARPR